MIAQAQGEQAKHVDLPFGQRFQGEGGLARGRGNNGSGLGEDVAELAEIVRRQRGAEAAGGEGGGDDLNHPSTWLRQGLTGLELRKIWEHPGAATNDKR